MSAQASAQALIKTYEAHQTSSRFSSQGSSEETWIELGELFNAKTIAEPGTIVQPGAIVQPEAVAQPETVAQPGAIVQPEAVAQPGAIVQPEAVAQPGAIVQSEAVAQPETVAEKTPEIWIELKDLFPKPERTLEPSEEKAASIEKDAEKAPVIKEAGESKKPEPIPLTPDEFFKKLYSIRSEILNTIRSAQKQFGSNNAFNAWSKYINNEAQRSTLKIGKFGSVLLENFIDKNQTHHASSLLQSLQTLIKGHNLLITEQSVVLGEIERHSHSYNLSSESRNSEREKHPFLEINELLQNYRRKYNQS